MASFTGTGGPAVIGRGSVPLPTGAVRYGSRPRPQQPSPWGRREQSTRRRAEVSRRPVRPVLMKITMANADRFRAVIKAYDRGDPYERITSQVGVTRSTIHRWVAHAAAGGLAPDDEANLAVTRAACVQGVLYDGKSVGAMAEGASLPDAVVQRWVDEALERRAEFSE